LRKYGLLKGGWMALKRLSRCLLILEATIPCRETKIPSALCSTTSPLPQSLLLALCTIAVWRFRRKNEADPLDWDSDDLALKVLIYSEGSDDNTPRVEIVFQESVGESYSYYMRWFTTDGPRFITGVHAINEKAGQEAAEALIGHFYRFKRVWKEKPTLGVMRKRKSESRTIGFLASE
jgi:hypothetical protein